MKRALAVALFLGLASACPGCRPPEPPAYPGVELLRQAGVPEQGSGLPPGQPAPPPSPAPADAPAHIPALLEKYGAENP